MSAIVVRSAKETIYPNLGRYFIAELVNGKHSLCVSVSPNGLQVLVANASHKAWRGMGRSFANLSEALDYYRTPEIRDMVAAAVRISNEPDSVRAAVVAAAGVTS